MAFFLFLGFVAVWLSVAPRLAKGWFAGDDPKQRMKRKAATLAVALAPFAHEFYVYLGFQAYCGIYAGTYELEPVATNSLRFNVTEAWWTRLLAHPSLLHVRYTGDLESRKLYPSVSLSSDPAACQSSPHRSLEAGNTAVTQYLVAQSRKRGFCYSNDIDFDEPRYELRIGHGHRKFIESGSLIYARKVRPRQLYEVYDTQEREVLSRFRTFETQTGFLFDILIPEMRHYGCISISGISSSDEYPFGENVYRFLDDAIVAN